MQIETVKIASPISDENPLGFIVINKSDLTEAMALFDAAPADALASPKKLVIADLRDALTAKGIEFDPAASKSDLQALFDAAPADAA